MKSIEIFQSYDHKCTATFFMVHSVYNLEQAHMTHRNRATFQFYFIFECVVNSRYVCKNIIKVAFMVLEK